MELVLLTALGVGGATVIGSLIGFIFKNISHKFSDIILSFAAGVMLAAAVLGLIVPSLEYGGKYGILITVAGIFVGAVCLNLIDKLSSPAFRAAFQSLVSGARCTGTVYRISHPFSMIFRGCCAFRCAFRSVCDTLCSGKCELIF